MGWKHIGKLHMGPPSTKECVGNVHNIESRIKANKIYMGEKKLYADIVIGVKKKRTIMSEMGRYYISTKVAVSRDHQY